MALSYQHYTVPICSMLVVLSSILCLAFKSTAYSSTQATDSGVAVYSFRLSKEFPNENISLATYPYYLRLSARKPLLVASSFALVVAIGVAALSAVVVCQRQPIKLMWYHRQAILFVLFANASLAMAAFIADFVLHSKSAHFSLSYRSIDGGFGSGDQYDRGVFDLETWTCEVKALPSFRSVGYLEKQCTMETAARGCSVVLFIFATALFVAVWWDAKRHGAIIAERYMDRTALDDEDDCELEEIAAKRHLGHIELQPKRP